MGSPSSPLSAVAGIFNNSNARKQLTGYRDSAQGLTNQANTNYYNDLYPRQLTQSDYLFNKGGYTPDEQNSQYQTADEMSQQYWNPNAGGGMFYNPTEQAGMFYNPAEQNSMRIGAQEGQNITNQALDPISGAATGARQAGLMAAAARGGYAPGLNATLEEVNRQQGRTAGNVAMQTGLGISAANRAANLNIANQRVNATTGIANQRTSTQQMIEDQRANTAARLAQLRTNTVKGIGDTRIGQQNLGAALTANQAALESGRQIQGLNQWGTAARGLAGVPSTTGGILNAVDATGKAIAAGLGG